MDPPTHFPKYDTVTLGEYRASGSFGAVFGVSLCDTKKRVTSNGYVIKLMAEEEAKYELDQLKTIQDQLEGIELSDRMVIHTCPVPLDKMANSKQKLPACSSLVPEVGLVFEDAGVDMLELINNGRPPLSVRVMQELEQFCYFFHLLSLKKVNHGDIKIENIIYGPTGFKLIDWGLAESYETSAKMVREKEPPKYHFTRNPVPYFPPMVNCYRAIMNGEVVTDAHIDMLTTKQVTTRYELFQLTGRYATIHRVVYKKTLKKVLKWGLDPKNHEEYRRLMITKLDAYMIGQFLFHLLDNWNTQLSDDHHPLLKKVLNKAIIWLIRTAITPDLRVVPTAGKLYQMLTRWLFNNPELSKELGIAKGAVVSDTANARSTMIITTTNKKTKRDETDGEKPSTRPLKRNRKKLG